MKWPSVSCVCITRNRRMFVRQAARYFLRASYAYPGKSELVIVDGSPESSPFGQNFLIHYHHEPSAELQVGKARNLACEHTSGDIILHWDDDDWQSPNRIALQAKALLELPNDGLVYSSRFYHYHIQQQQAAKAKSWDGGNGSMGALFAYWRETWKKTPFEDVATGDDIHFEASLRVRGCPMLDMRDSELIVYIRHNQNQSAMTQYDWNVVDTADARKIMRTDLDFYDGLGELLPVANWCHPNAPGSKAHVMNPLQQSWARHFK